MRVLVIYCHPVAESSAASAHRTVLEALVEAGHEFTDVDLYAEHFDPVMSRQERLDYLNTDRNERPVRRYDDSRAVRALCARDCRVTWCVHYDMDRTRAPELRRFLQRIRRATLRLQGA